MSEGEACELTTLERRRRVRTADAVAAGLPARTPSAEQCRRYQRAKLPEEPRRCSQRGRLRTRERQSQNTKPIAPPPRSTGIMPIICTWMKADGCEGERDGGRRVGGGGKSSATDTRACQ